MRNEVIFNGKSFDLEIMVTCVKFRFVAWAKAKWPKIKDSGWEDIWSTKIVVSTLKTKTDGNKVCTALALGALKFNVDGASAGNPESSGISGALRDETDVVLLVFSKRIGYVESPLTELLASSAGLIHILHLLGDIGIISTGSNLEASGRQLEHRSHPRVLNEMVDKLAKEDINRTNPHVVVYGQ
ncbi:hypothetical protein REPUB_Repub15cG0055600 [Reevesia pubescens]